MFTSTAQQTWTNFIKVMDQNSSEFMYLKSDAKIKEWAFFVEPPITGSI
jgi:hypothetical protein